MLSQDSRRSGRRGNAPTDGTDFARARLRFSLNAHFHTRSAGPALLTRRDERLFH